MRGCEPECPNEAISNANTIYVIDPAKYGRLHA